MTQDSVSFHAADATYTLNFSNSATFGESSATITQGGQGTPLTVQSHESTGYCISGPGCPCFGQQTTLPLSKTGAPGAFALIDLDNGTGNGSSTLGNWVLNGFAAYLGLGPYSSNTGAKFNSTDIDNALDARIGTVLMFPVYDTIVMQGTNAVYNVIGWVGFLLGGYKITGGNSGSLTGSFTEITWQGIPATQGNGPPNLGARVVTLTR